MGQLLGRHELEVDMEERWPIERDEEPRLAHVIAGERREERAESPRQIRPVAQNRAGDLGARDHDEVEVGMLVQRPAMNEPPAASVAELVDTSGVMPKIRRPTG